MCAFENKSCNSEHEMNIYNLRINMQLIGSNAVMSTKRKHTLFSNIKIVNLDLKYYITNVA